MARNPSAFDASARCSTRSACTVHSSRGGGKREVKPNVPGSEEAQPEGCALARSYCEATVELVRSRRGNGDAAFGEGGTLTAMQVRWISFRSVEELDPESAGEKDE